jgi:hypothetical protein
MGSWSNVAKLTNFGKNLTNGQVMILPVQHEVVFIMQVVTFYEDDIFPYMQWFMNILKGQPNEILVF